MTHPTLIKLQEDLQRFPPGAPEAFGEATPYVDPLWLFERYGRELAGQYPLKGAAAQSIAADRRDLLAKLGTGEAVSLRLLEPLQSYWRLAQSLAGNPNLVVVDIGCGDAWQQMFFQDHGWYFGVEPDLERSPAVLQSNAEIFRRSIEDLVMQGEVDLHDNVVALVSPLLKEPKHQATLEFIYSRFKRVLLA